jgi:hypothetical protein
VYTDANIVMGAESADFFFDCWYLKVITLDSKRSVIGPLDLLGRYSKQTIFGL